MEDFDHCGDYYDAEARQQWLDPIVVVSGGFDPIHEGHVALLNAAAKHGSVHVLLNSADWLARKKGCGLLPYESRRELLVNISSVHRVHSVDDKDDTVFQGLIALRKKYPKVKMFFANGGDRKNHNTPEMVFCESLDIEPLWNIGGEKIASSSEFLNTYVEKQIQGQQYHREWGYYTILEQGQNWLVKKLVFFPGKALSLQKHFLREEQWLILEGDGLFWGSSLKECTDVSAGVMITIAEEQLHWVKNTHEDKPLVILETWFGELLESDIERIDDETIIPK